jgi:hypothetical protein
MSKRKKLMDLDVIAPSDLDMTNFTGWGPAQTWLDKLKIYIHSMQDVGRVCIVHLDTGEDSIRFSSIPDNLKF